MTKFTGRDMAAMTRRILAWHDRASDAQREAGATWYDDARRFAGQLAASSGYSIEQVAGTVAVLSPQATWTSNMQAAIDAVALHAAGDRPDVLPGYSGYRANVAKAWQVLDGDMSAVRGPKVSAFHAAIVGDLSHVTVDVWAIRAARSKDRNLALAWLDVEQDGTVEKRAIGEAYRRAAALRGITPSVMQAIVWVTVRESAEWAKPRTDADRARFYRRQARARVAQGMPAMHSYWGDTAKRERVAQAIGAGAAA